MLLKNKCGIKNFIIPYSKHKKSKYLSITNINKFWIEDYYHVDTNYI